MNYQLFTIGYSVYDIDSFILTIKKHNINAIADVRSQPYSQFKPEFNREQLSNRLKEEKIYYVFLGDLVGARISDPECYINGKADYALIAKNSLFLSGLDRIKKGLKKYRIALMCAEKDPITCHRTILICRNIKSEDISISHVLHDGSLEKNERSEERLMNLHGMDGDQLEIPGIGLTREEKIEDAYNKQGQKIAYTDNDAPE